MGRKKLFRTILLKCGRYSRFLPDEIFIRMRILLGCFCACVIKHERFQVETGGRGSSLPPSCTRGRRSEVVVLHRLLGVGMYLADTVSLYLLYIRAVSMVYISNRVSDGVKVWSTCLSESDVVRSQTALYHCFSITVAGEASRQTV